MRLIVSYWVGSEYEGGEYVFPAEYKSAEDLLCDIEKACKECYDENGHLIKHSFKVGGCEFHISDIVHREDDGVKFFSWPDIYTIDEWFEKYTELIDERSYWGYKE